MEQTYLVVIVAADGQDLGSTLFVFVQGAVGSIFGDHILVHDLIGRMGDAQLGRQIAFDRGRRLAHGRNAAETSLHWLLLRLLLQLTSKEGSRRASSHKRQIAGGTVASSSGTGRRTARADGRHGKGRHGHRSPPECHGPRHHDGRQRHEGIRVSANET